MKNISTLGKQLSKTEQKRIIGGEAAMVGELYCGPFGGPYTPLGLYDNCNAQLQTVCYDGGPYEYCYCQGGNPGQVCWL